MGKTSVVICGPPLSAVGGGPTHVRNLLASGLEEQYRLVHFETGSRGRESPARDEKVLAAALRILRSPFGLARAILVSRARIVHVNSVLDHRALWRDAVYLTIGKLLGCKVVLQFHGGSLPLMCRYRGVRHLVRGVLRLPDAVVLLASQERRDFATQGLRERLFVIPNGIDVASFQGAGPRMHSGRVRRLAYMGRLIRAKGVFETMAAVELLLAKREFHDLELLIAGSGPDRSEIERHIRDRRLGERVKLVGPVEGRDKIAFLKAADIFVFPTYHLEGLPYSVLESLAAGTPVVATPVGGIPDVVIDRVHGRLVPPRDPAQLAAALEELAGRPAALRAMSRECMVWAADAFGLARLADRFAELYASLDRQRATAGAPTL